MKKTREALAYTPAELSFGTSGLRGLVADMTDLECYVNASGFIRFLEQADRLPKQSDIYLAGDLRKSTARVLRAMHQAIKDSGHRTVYCGLFLHLRSRITHSKRAHRALWSPAVISPTTATALSSTKQMARC